MPKTIAGQSKGLRSKVDAFWTARKNKRDAKTFSKFFAGQPKEIRTLLAKPASSIEIDPLSLHITAGTPRTMVTTKAKVITDKPEEGHPWVTGNTIIPSMRDALQKGMPRLKTPPVGFDHVKSNTIIARGSSNPLESAQPATLCPRTAKKLHLERKHLHYTQRKQDPIARAENPTPHRDRTNNAARSNVKQV